MFDCFNDFMMIVLTWFRNYMQITPHQVQINFYIQDVHKKNNLLLWRAVAPINFLIKS